MIHEITRHKIGFVACGTFANSAAFSAGGLDVKCEEHDGAVGQVGDEVRVASSCDGRVQQRSSPLCSGSPHPVVVPQLED